MKELTHWDLQKIWQSLPFGDSRQYDFARAITAADRALNAECHDPLTPQQMEVIADPTLRAVCEAYTNTPGGHFVRLQAVAKLVHAPADRDVMRQAPEGWRLVPIEPTHEMIYMMTRATNNLAERIDSYREMLATAPTPPAEQPATMVDMGPPATSRDRWMYEQGRLAERDPRTPPAEQPNYTHADVTDAHAKGFALGLAQKDRPVEQQGEQKPSMWAVTYQGEFNRNVYTTEAEAWMEKKRFDDVHGKCDRKVIPLYTHPTPSLAALRARVEVLSAKSVVRTNTPEWIRKSDVLAEIDKLGGKE